MVEKMQSWSGKVPSNQRQIDAKTRQIAKYFCGTCNAKIVESNGEAAVVFKLRLPEHEAILTPPIPLHGKLDPDPIEYFVRTLYSKTTTAEMQP